MISNYLITGVLLLAICYLLFPLVIRLSRQWGLVDKPTGRKRHREPVPFTGGWVVFAGFWLGLVALVLIDVRVADELRPYLAYIFAAHLVIFLGGVIDDKLDLKPLQKLAIQFVAAVILFVGGLSIHTISIPFTGSFALHPVASFAVTTFWLLAIVNAVNNIDGLDGLLGGLAMIAAIGLLYTAVVLQIPVVMAITTVTMAVVLAFLRYNFPPAKVFLGDSGSQTLGFIFALGAIYCPVKSYTVVALFIPILVLGVPLMEFGLTFLRRLITGRNVMKADLGHLHHMLLRRGISQVHTLLIFWGVAAALQVFVFTLFLFDRRVVFSILVLFMLIVAGWFRQLSRKEVR